MEYLNRGPIEKVLKGYNINQFLDKEILKDMVLSKNSSINLLKLNKNNIFEKDRTQYNLNLK